MNKYQYTMIHTDAIYKGIVSSKSRLSIFDRIAAALAKEFDGQRILDIHIIEYVDAHTYLVEFSADGAFGFVSITIQKMHA